MENLHVAAPEIPARVNLGRRRTGAPRAANDNDGLALAIAGESVVVDAAEAAESILRAMARAKTAEKRAEID